ncbi:GT2 family glycosyltransferase [Novosphingobium capsulatum]|uniref:GT2 family glycosyltransferase n=1 Tax=Novosphingobium capsulatum TaxID=13688 RepID=A0ABU1MQB5_9SPHN|nr:glycosyltransferase family 2 protein [Novosphingobium sp. AAP1]MDR6512528.1 GT2 family glycosyltransferase [Novosphingobium capsulatum]
MAKTGANQGGVSESLLARIGFRVRLVWCVLAVYFDALRMEPAKFLVATKWWILRKKVRARGQFAPLLSRSSRAYPLWLLKRHRGRSRDLGIDPLAAAVIALVDTSGPHDALQLQQTIKSLHDQGVAYHTVQGAFRSILPALIADLASRDSAWIMPIMAGDSLASGAMAAYRQAIVQTQASIIYADDDCISPSGKRHDPHFKPDWNAPLFECCDYVTGACLLRADLPFMDTAADRRDWASCLVRQALDTTPVKPVHVPAVLHHRLQRPQPMLPLAKLTSLECFPLVSVIIPTRNRVDLLRTCLDGLARTAYPNLEVIVVDNDSDDVATLDYLARLDSGRYRVLRHHGPFNYSAINNRAVSQASGELICLLNNDIEIIASDWLAIMVTAALKPDVGAVGARLLYPDGRIQHAGVVIGMGNAAGHAHRFVNPAEVGYFSRHNLPQFTTAVTAACLVVRRDRFYAAGMLDEENFPVAFNDVDLCLRLNEMGWQSFYEPRATLIHHESVSRGRDADPIGAARFARELAALQQRWHTAEFVDSYHHPDLSRASETFVIRL